LMQPYQQLQAAPPPPQFPFPGQAPGPQSCKNSMSCIDHFIKKICSKL
jgi:hypothetical protein